MVCHFSRPSDKSAVALQEHVNVIMFGDFMQFHPTKDEQFWPCATNRSKSENSIWRQVRLRKLPIRQLHPYTIPRFWAPEQTGGSPWKDVESSEDITDMLNRAQHSLPNQFAKSIRTKGPGCFSRVPTVSEESKWTFLTSRVVQGIYVARHVAGHKIEQSFSKDVRGDSISPCVTLAAPSSSHRLQIFAHHCCDCTLPACSNFATQSRRLPSCKEVMRLVI